MFESTALVAAMFQAKGMKAEREKYVELFFAAIKAQLKTPATSEELAEAAAEEADAREFLNGLIDAVSSVFAEVAKDE